MIPGEATLNEAQSLSEKHDYAGAAAKYALIIPLTRNEEAKRTLELLVNYYKRLAARPQSQVDITSLQGAVPSSSTLSRLASTPRPASGSGGFRATGGVRGDYGQQLRESRRPTSSGTSSVASDDVATIGHYHHANYDMRQMSRPGRVTVDTPLQAPDASFFLVPKSSKSKTTKQSIEGQESRKQGGKSMEELVLENAQLKALLDQMSSKTYALRQQQQLLLQSQKETIYGSGVNSANEGRPKSSRGRSDKQSNK